MYRPIITMSLAFRPDYTRQVLEALKQCRGIEKYEIIAFCEPTNPETIATAAAIDFCKKQVHVNQYRMGCDCNILQAISAGFALTDYNIHIEDDIVLSIDALEYFEYCRERYKNDDDIFTVTAYNRDGTHDQPLHQLKRRPWFHPWGWASWRARFPDMLQHWERRRGGQLDQAGMVRGSSWDAGMTFKARGLRQEIYPAVSRSQNIGKENGENVSPSDHRCLQHVEYWAGPLQPIPQTWSE